MFYKRKGSLLFNFILSYILVMSVPLLIGGLAYWEAYRIVKEDALRSNLVMLEQTKEIMDGRLSEVQKIANQLSLNSKVKYFMSVDDVSKKDLYYDVWAMLPELRPYTITDDFIASLLLHFRRSDMIISTNTSYSLSEFYGTYFKYGDSSFEKWRRLALDGADIEKYIPSEMVTCENRTFSAVTYLHRLSIGYGGNNDATIMLLLDEAKIAKMLGKINFYSTGWAYITDETGNIITSVSSSDKPVLVERDGSEPAFFQKTLNNEKMLVITTKSAYNGWDYVAVLPLKNILAKVDYLRNILFGTAFISLLIGIVLAFCLSYNKARILKDVIQYISGFIAGGTESHGNAYEYLNSSIKRIIHDSRELKQEMEGQKPLIKAAFMERLFKGGYIADKDLEVYQKRMELDLKGKCYAALAVNVAGYDAPMDNYMMMELDAIKFIIMEKLSQNSHTPVHMHYIDERSIALLICYPAEDRQECTIQTENLVKTVRSHLYQEHGINAVFAAGELCAELSDIGWSYGEAKKLMEYKLLRKIYDPMLWHHEMTIGNEPYFYSIDTEIIMMNVVKTGNKEEALKILDRIYQENTMKKQLSLQMLQQLIAEIKGTLYKLNAHEMESGEMAAMLRQIESNKNMDEIFDTIKKIFGVLCDGIANRQKRGENDLADEIVSFLQENYANQDISLALLADKYQVNEMYISHLFKERVGHNFFSYLESLRLEKACAILTDSRLPIKEIAESVGYSNDKSFRRAFKRVKGISPTDMRKNS